MGSPDPSCAMGASVAAAAVAVARNAMRDMQEIQAHRQLASDCMRYVADLHVATASLAARTLGAPDERLTEDSAPAVVAATSELIALVLAAAAEEYLCSLTELADSASGHIATLVDEAQEIVSTPMWRRL